MPTATFTVNDTEEKISLVSQLLKANQVRFSKDDGERNERIRKHQALVKHFREEPLLTGHGDELAKLRKEFREDFGL
jgi:hypothetical protein